MSIAGIGRRPSWSFRALLMSAAVLIAGGAAAEDDAEWAAEVSLSVTSQSGTTDTFAGTFDAKTERTSESDYLKARLKAEYGTSKTRKDGIPGSETIQDNQALFGDWKHTIDDRFFWESGSELSRDSTQNREIRAALDTGPGYRVWRSNEEGKDHFDLMGGVGYRYEVYETVVHSATDRRFNDASHFIDLVAGFEYKNRLFDDKIDFTHTGAVKAPANSFNDFIATTEVIIGVPLTESWSFRTAFFVEYVNEVPENIDELTTRTTVGLGYTF